MKNLTYIIPVHVYNDELLNNALKSIELYSPSSSVIIVGGENVLNEYDGILNNFNSLKINKVVNNGEKDFFTQINCGVYQCVTPYFSILEFDDEITPNWMKNAEKYVGTYNDISLFMPLIELIDDKTKNTVGLANELAWSTAFVDELGFIDVECLKTFYDFQIVGGICKTEDFIAIGGFKPSLMIAATYELLLRLAYNGKKIFTIPKIGYKHTCGRDDSYMVKCKDEITQEHGEWLIKTAQQEMFFKEDRNKKFNE